MSRIVYVSTGNVFGDTQGEVVDETYERDLDEGFLSYYDETKYLSHEIAQERIAKGAPIVIVQPGVVYGPGDHSEIGNLIDQTRTGKLQLRMFPQPASTSSSSRTSPTGSCSRYDKGKIGESYLLGGEQVHDGRLFDKAARCSGRKPPKLHDAGLRWRRPGPARPGDRPADGLPAEHARALKTSDGVTLDDRRKARRELGFAPRDFDTGLRQTLGVS